MKNTNRELFCVFKILAIMGVLIILKIGAVTCRPLRPCPPIDITPVEASERYAHVPFKVSTS
jgi:hypothetical protein